MNRRGRVNRTKDRATGSGSGESAEPLGKIGRMRRRRRSRILGMWARIAMLSAAIGVLLLIAVALVAKAVHPFTEANTMQNQLSATNDQIAEIDAQNAAYQRQLNYLKTPAGQEAEARQLGYLRPGEIAVVLAGTPGDLQETSNVAPHPPAPSLMGRIRRFLSNVFDAH